MTRLDIAIVTAALAATVVPTLPAQTAAPACTAAEHRQFDFWIGEWDVHQADGKLAGRNTITRAHGGCVIEERYTGARGYTGASLNIYDVSRDRWHQTWVDNGGLLLQLDGAFRGGTMVLEGETVDSAGAIQKQRITWAPLPGGKVRQHWEQSTDGGASWSSVFDGIYTKRR